jgi:hypothetical protein
MDEFRSRLQAGLVEFVLVPLASLGIAKMDEFMPLQIRVLGDWGNHSSGVS